MPRNIATATTFTYLQLIQWQPVRLLIYLCKIRTLMVKYWPSDFFIRAGTPESSCLHYLLPDKRDSDILNKLWCPKIFQPLTVNTVRFRKSFLPYCITISRVYLLWYTNIVSCNFHVRYVNPAGNNPSTRVCGCSAGGQHDMRPFLHMRPLNTIIILLPLYIILLYYFTVSERINPAFGCNAK